MQGRITFILCLLILAVAGCSTPYQRMSAVTITGGYSDHDLGHDVIRVEFSANGFTSRETAQSFWLWRCAEVTLEKHFDGFEILSDMRLADGSGVRTYPRSDADGGHFQKAAYIPIYVPTPDESNKPHFAGDIHLLKAPVAVQPPKIFDARELKDALGPYVLPIIKSPGNIKPHIHDYLLPAGKLASQAPAT